MDYLLQFILFFLGFLSGIVFVILFGGIRIELQQSIKIENKNEDEDKSGE